MKLTDSVTDLLGSVAGLHGLVFEIWSGQGERLFSTNGTPPRAARESAIASSVGRLRNGARFLELNADSQPIWGVPLGLPCGDHGGLFSFASDGEARALPAPQVRNVLTALRRILEERWEIQGDIETLTEELERTYNDLYLFSQIATQLKTIHFSGDMLRGLVGELREAMRADIAVARIAGQPEFDVLLSNGPHGCGADALGAFVGELLERLPRHAARFEDNGYLVADADRVSELKALAPARYRALGVHIRHGEDAQGWLLLVSFNMDEIFRRGEYKLLTSLAEQVGVVIANSRLYHALESLVMNMVRSLITAIEAKDDYTRGHSDRVSALTLRVGRAMDLPEDALRDLAWAATLHDIGKIGTPECILNKTGRLTEDEFDVIRRHPRRGADILAPMSQLAGALPGVLHHHERYDGRGYPDGLAGEAIPLFGRIIAVADAFDAITSDRAYRKGRDAGAAIEAIRASAGRQFDPRIVETLCAVIDEGQASAVAQCEVAAMAAP